MCGRYFGGFVTSSKKIPDDLKVELAAPGIVRVSQNVVDKYGLDFIRAINGGHCEVVVKKEDVVPDQKDTVYLGTVWSESSDQQINVLEDGSLETNNEDFSAEKGRELFRLLKGVFGRVSTKYQ